MYEEQIIHQVKESIFQGNIIHSMIFLGWFEDCDAIKILTDLYSNDPVFLREPYKYYKWEIVQLLETFGIESTGAEEIKIPIRIFSEIFPKLYKLLIVENKSIYNDNVINDRKIKKILLQLSSSLYEYRSLIHSVSSTTSAFIHGIPEKVAFSVLGLDALDFFQNAPFNISYNPKLTECIRCFSYPINYTQPLVTYILQTKILNQVKFPEKVLPFENGSFLSLLNISIDSGTHFVQHIYNAYQNYNQKEKHMEIFAALDYLNEMFAWLAVNEENVRGNEKYLSFIFDNSDGSVKELVTRFLSDIELDLEVKANNILDFSSDHSIIYLFKSYLMSPAIEELLTLKYFQYSDKDISIDHDFLVSYWALSLAVIFVNQTDIKKGDTALSKLNGFMNSIVDPKVKENIIIDLFSLLFLTNSEGVFLVSAETATRMVVFLSKFSDLPYIANALERVSSLKSIDTITSFFIGSQMEFLDSLGRRDFVSAEICVPKELKEILFLAKEVNGKESSGISDRAKIERFFVSEKIEGPINFENHKYTDEVKILYSKLTHNNEERIVEKEEQLNDVAKALDFNPMRFSVSDEEIEKSMKYFNFYRFIKSYKIAIQSSLPLKDQICAGAVYGLEKSEKIASALGIDFFDYVIQNCNSFSEEFISKYVSKFRPVFTCLKFNGITTSDQIQLNNTLLKYKSLIEREKPKKEQSNIRLSDFAQKVAQFVPKSIFNLFKSNPLSNMLDEGQSSSFSDLQKPLNKIVSSSETESEFLSEMTRIRGFSKHIDDIFYRIDPNKLENILVSHRNELRMEQLCHLSKFIGEETDFRPFCVLFENGNKMPELQFEEEEDYDKYDNENPTFERYTRNDFAKEEIEKLELFERLRFIYVRYGAGREAKTKVCHFLKGKVLIGEQIRKICELFPTFATDIYRVLDPQNRPKLFYNYVGKSRALFRNYSKLPEIIIENAEFEDSHEIANALINNIECIDECLPLIPSLLKKKDIQRVFERYLEYHSSSLFLLTRAMEFVYSFYKCTSIDLGNGNGNDFVLDISSKLAKRIINQTEVNSIESEIKASKMLRLAKNSELMLDQKEIDLLEKICDESLFAKYEISYSFNDLHKLSEDLFEMNEFELGITIAEFIGSDAEKEIHRRCLQCLRLGLIEEAKSFANKTTLSLSEIEYTLKFDSFDKTINDTIKRNIKQERYDNDIVDIIKLFVKPEENAVYQLCIEGCLDAAYDLTLSMENTTKLLIGPFISGCIQSIGFESFCAFIKTKDPKLEKHMGLWSSLRRYLSLNELNYSLAIADTFIGFYGEASRLFSKQIAQQDLIQLEITTLNRALSCLDELEHLRTSHRSSEDLNVLTEPSVVDIEAERKDLRLQLSVLKFAANEGLNGCFDILGDEHRMNSIGMVFGLCNFGIAEKIIHRYRIPMGEVFKSSAAFLANRGIVAIKKYINFVSNKYKSSESAVTEIFEALSKQRKQRDLFEAIVEFKKSPEEMCKTLIKYNLGEFAYYAAIENNLTRLIPQILLIIKEENDSIL